MASWLARMKKERADKALRKKAATVANKSTSSDNRYVAMDALKEIGSEEAILGLLGRFHFTGDQTVVDGDEKQYVTDLVLSFGEKSVAPLRAYLNRCTYPAWPIRILSDLVDQQTLVGTLLDLLDEEDTAFQRSAEEKCLEILRHLEDFEDPRVTRKAISYLDHFSDDIRLAAIQLLENQGDEEAKKPLLERMIDDEAPRVQVAVAEVFVRRGWTAHGFGKALAKALPEGFYMTNDKKIKQRG